MEFNNLFHNKLYPLFSDNNFVVVEEFENYIKVKANHIVLTIVHDNRERSNQLYIGRNENNMNAIDDEVLVKVFRTNLRIDNTTMEGFIDNVADFLRSIGKKLLEGDMNTLSEIERFSYKRSDEFTSQLMDRQYLSKADEAWKKGNYQDVIKYLNKIKESNIPASYKKKYEIAKGKMD